MIILSIALLRVSQHDVEFINGSAYFFVLCLVNVKITKELAEVEGHRLKDRSKFAKATQIGRVKNELCFSVLNLVHYQVQHAVFPL